MSDPSDTDTAWLAGLLEGEGNFVPRFSTVCPGKRLSPYVRLKMTDRDVVERALTIVPSGEKISVALDPRPRRSDCYVARWNGKNAYLLMEKISPFMGIRRGDKIDACLGYRPAAYTKIPLAHQPAWLAGLLEGEGCFYLLDRPRPQLMIKLNMTDKDVIERAHAVCGFPGSVHRLVDKRSDKFSDNYRFHCCSANAERIMRLVLPYMGERRSAKIKECLSTPNLSHTPKVKST